MCAKSNPVPQKTPSKNNAGIRSWGRRKLNFKIVITRAHNFRNVISVSVLAVDTRTLENIILSSIRKTSGVCRQSEAAMIV
jgi:hypothetical protein